MNMKFLVDTSVWSESLRRKNVSFNTSQTILTRLISNEYEVYLSGIILQEILSGITDKKLFNEINTILSEFPYIETTKKDYIYAAEIRNLLKTKGISAGSIDFLISSIAINNNLTLVTTDKDFEHISKYTNLKLLDFNKVLGNVR